MSRKKSRTRIVCPVCRRRVKAKHARCPSCGTVNPSPSRKALKTAVAASTRAAFIGKAAGTREVLCPAGHRNRRGAACCAACGVLMPGVPVPAVAMVGKSALATEYWRREMAGSPDPGQREMFWRMLHGDGGRS